MIKVNMQSILDTQHVQHKNVNYDELIEYIFFKNSNNKRLILQTPTLKNSKDIFCFCFDLFCKGLVYCYGYETKRVEIDQLSMEQIQYVIDKLGYTGIMTIIQIETDDDDTTSSLLEYDNNKDERASSSALEVVKQSVKGIYEPDENKSLCNYVFRLKVREYIYAIRFELQMI